VHAALTERALARCDVAIEFSLPEAVLENARIYAAAGTAAVIGTTGWLDQLRDLEAIMADAGGGIVYGSNFSVGAHIFVAAARYAASLVKDIGDYDLMIHEMHHRKKKDSPSGTAITLAEAVLDAVPRKKRVETGRLDRAPEPDELHVSSSRCGAIPGTHTLYLDSAADTIKVSHEARSRGGFALGAVLAAEWVIGKQGIHPVESFIKDLLHGNSGG
jgi:4-hydroxy-tetrahydrodipicolinate reductase